MVKPIILSTFHLFFSFTNVYFFYIASKIRKRMSLMVLTPNHLKIAPLLPHHIQLSRHDCAKGCVNDLNHMHGLNHVCVCVRACVRACVCVCIVLGAGDSGEGI